ncbi:MAG: hypothetical protein AB8G18_13325 [Gammaproteobacteria bacterium]
MNDEYVKTLVMDVSKSAPQDALYAAEVADRHTDALDEMNEPSQPAQVTRSYSYLT